MKLKSLKLQEFAQAATPETLQIVYNEGYWEARCQHAVLLKPDGDVGFINLSALLSILAGVGIRCSKIEWDGLPVFSYEPQKPDEASIAHEEMMLQVLAQISDDAEREGNQ